VGDEGDKGDEGDVVVSVFPMPHSQQKLSNYYKRMNIVLIKDPLTNMRKLM
jgi:hypothetical protein